MYYNLKMAFQCPKFFLIQLIYASKYQIRYCFYHNTFSVKYCLPHPPSYPYPSILRSFTYLS